MHLTVMSTFPPAKVGHPLLGDVWYSIPIIDCHIQDNTEDLGGARELHASWPMYTSTMVGLNREHGSRLWCRPSVPAKGGPIPTLSCLFFHSFAIVQVVEMFLHQHSILYNICRMYFGRVQTHVQTQVAIYGRSRCGQMGSDGSDGSDGLDGLDGSENSICGLFAVSRVEWRANLLTAIRLCTRMNIA